MGFPVTDSCNELTATVGELGPRGDGIADGDAGRLYIAGALAGETVRVRPPGKRGEGLAAKRVEVIRRSPDRVAAPCRHFDACGGCSVQHLEIAAYHDWKRG